eukprot:3297223-Pleurochrysis_carterae.AAC.1
MHTHTCSTVRTHSHAAHADARKQGNRGCTQHAHARMHGLMHVLSSPMYVCSRSRVCESVACECAFECAWEYTCECACECA